jgi:hypothetical protein
MRRFRKASIPDDINEIERSKIDNSTSNIQQQLNESPDQMPSNMVFEPNAEMSACIRTVQYSLLPVLVSGEIQMTGELAALYTSLIRCLTEFEHALHAVRAIHSIKYHSKDFGVQDPQMFGVLIGQQILAQDERRMESFKEMTYTLSEMSKLPSVAHKSIADYIVQIVDKCEAAMGQDVSEYYLMS